MNTEFLMDTNSKKITKENFDYDWMPARAVLRQWKTSRAKRLALADSTGAELTGGNALVRLLVLKRLLEKYVLAPDEKNVGILLPPSVPAILVNAALTVGQRVTVNLNYTLNEETLNYCIRKAKIRHLITSRKVMEKFDFHPECEVIYLEDYVKKLTLWDKISSALLAKRSLKTLYRKFGLDSVDLDDTMAIIFTSGSTGIPKGVMLSHRNIGGNVIACRDHFRLTDQDSMLGMLPLFHSLGFMATIWAILGLGMAGYYHFSPLEPRPIAKLCRKYRPTILPATPTFLRMYLRRMEPDDLKSLSLIISGAEKCPVALMDEYEKTLGVRPAQGYGITETSPVLSANVPKTRVPSEDEALVRDESLGYPLPGVEVKILDLDTGKPCAPGKRGMLYVRGIYIMKGYYDEPEKTAEVIDADGWYRTGDLVTQDKDGFIYIAGRLSRFAKIGGEMVPHEGIEAKLNELLGNPDEETPKLCVTSIPDEKKGEKIIVLFTELQLSPQQIKEKLLELKYPALWIPDLDAYYQIDAIPILGTGKLDLYAIHETAMKYAESTFRA